MKAIEKELVTEYLKRTEFATMTDEEFGAIVDRIQKEIERCKKLRSGLYLCRGMHIKLIPTTVLYDRKTKQYIYVDDRRFINELPPLQVTKEQAQILKREIKELDKVGFGNMSENI